MLKVMTTSLRRSVAYCQFLAKCLPALYRNDSVAVIIAAQRARSAIPHSSVVFLLLSSAYLTTAQYSDAVDLLQKGITMFPGDFQLNKLLVQAILAKTGRLDEAAPYVRAYLSNRPAAYRVPWFMVMLLWLAERTSAQGLNIKNYLHSLMAEEEQWASWAEKQLAALHRSDS